MQVRYRLAVDLTCGLAILASIWATLLQPQISGSGPRWALLTAQFVLVIVLRWLAAWRWRVDDWPRTQRAQLIS
jgi:hypothetical protein